MAARDGRLRTLQEQRGNCLAGLHERLEAGRPRLRSAGADYLGVQVLDSIVDGYFPLLERFAERLEGIEERVLLGGGDDPLGELYHAKRDLVMIWRAAWPLSQALGALERDKDAFVTETTRPFLRDVIDHVTQAVEMTETYRELCTGLIDVHLSRLSMRTNEVMRLLAVVSTVFIPLTFLAGVYGMNFDREAPGNLPELGLPYGYAAFWIVCAVVGGALLIGFRRLGWLRLPSRD